MTVYRKRRQSLRQRQRQRQRRRTQRGGGGPSTSTVSKLKALFEGKSPPAGSRPVQSGKLPKENVVREVTPPVPLEGTPPVPLEVTPPVPLEGLQSVRVTPPEAVQSESIAEEKARQAAEKGAANAEAQARQNAKQAEIEEMDRIMKGLNVFAANPRGAWPGVSTPTKAPTPGASNSFYSLPREQRTLMAAETRKQLTAQEQGQEQGQGQGQGQGHVQPTYFYSDPYTSTHAEVHGQGYLPPPTPSTRIVSSRRKNYGGARKRTRKARS